MLRTAWEPPVDIARDEIVTISDEVLARPDRPISVREEIFRINVLGLDWDIGGMVYEPTDPAGIAVGADGKQVGIFLLHGGGGDHRGKDQMGRFLAAKFGYKVATMTYPGHLYLLDPSRDWPGDTINPDGTARTPLWQIDQPITPDQYELVQDRSDPVLRAKYGTLFFLKAREGTDFYDRMASWPMAFEEAMKEVCRRNFPVGGWTVYVHGHSTGGPFVHMLLQRVDNIAGLVGMESSPFGAIANVVDSQGWNFPFNNLMIRTWRDTARYAGPENGMAGIRRLPWLMDDVLEGWQKVKHLPGIKAEHLVQFAATAPLGEAARASARRLGLDAAETEALVKRFQGYPRELSGPGVKPVPPLLYGINADSRDHTIERYRNQLLPELAAMNPAPKVRVMRFGTGVHNYEKPEEGLPRGTLPAVVELWNRAITGGYYLPEA
jgi:hypothetical protein